MLRIVRIEETIICFQDLLTFQYILKIYYHILCSRIPFVICVKNESSCLIWKSPQTLYKVPLRRFQDSDKSEKKMFSILQNKMDSLNEFWLRTWRTKNFTCQKMGNFWSSLFLMLETKCSLLYLLKQLNFFDR